MKKVSLLEAKTKPELISIVRKLRSRVNKLEAEVQSLLGPLNPHVMCASKVQLLEILARFGDWVKVEEGKTVTYNGVSYAAPYRARAHASRLVWFKLVDRSPIHRSGLYRININGLKFLQGKSKVPSKIWCRKGKVFEWERPLMKIDEVRNVTLTKDYWDKYSLVQRKSGEQRLIKN